MLITETDAQGELIKDYLWQGMMPIAQINHAQDTEQILYLYSDHLMTNRLATNATQHIVWRWEGEAFGNTPAQELIGISVNLRFPGQYFDEETNLHYNMMRYYDPELGRYITSDPIGLKGGLNTYVYAMQNSVVNIDFFGLDVIYNGNVILNPQVHDNLHKLDVVLPGYDVIITGGDRYRDANGNIVSASNDQIVLDSAKKSPHLYGQGARGVDLVVPNATNEQIAKAAKDAGFDPARTIHYPKDDHTHLVLPEDSTYNIPQHIVDEFCKQNPAAKMCNPSPPACP
ncbi:Rhs family protein [uncultured Candidatus Thioglobus sp.]|nr:Rhs family protein [uncultured Candidatus Thioglobus sp.]